MLRLYGITHTAFIDSLFSSRPVSIEPSTELLEDLALLPKGARVGIEWFAGNDWLEIQDDLARRSVENDLHNAPCFDVTASHYWEDLMDELESLGLHPVFLENKEIWLRHNQAVVDLVKGNQKELFYEGESERDYHQKLCAHNEEKRKRVLAVRNIHELERDHLLLHAVASGNVAAAVIGMGHADYWMANRARIEEHMRICIGSYAKQQPTGNPYPLTSFVRNAEPDISLIAQRESLERAIKLMEQGRIAEEAPDYVGTWCDYEPSKGYFEVFVLERDGERISGIIEDLLGTARFDGSVNGDGIQFTKTYGDNASPEAVKGEIFYQAQRQGREFFGKFNASGFHSLFYLIAADKKDPVEMGVRLFELQSS